MSPDSDSVEKFFHEASVKKILVLVRNMGFEGFLAKQFVDFGMSNQEVFDSIVCDVTLAIEYAVRKGDKSLLESVKLLIEKLESEQNGAHLARLIAEFIKKAISLDKDKISISKIVWLPELSVFFIFSNKISTDNKPLKSVDESYKYN